MMPLLSRDSGSTNGRGGPSRNGKTAYQGARLSILSANPANLCHGHYMVGTYLLFSGRDMTEEVINNEARGRYELHAEGGLAVAYYEPRGGAIAFTHTIVPERLQGHGIASILIKAALADVRRRGFPVIAECPFVARYIERHPEERDLLAE